MAHDVPELETVDLSFAVDDTPIARGVDLTVPPGETLCVVGPSGAGKSTLLGLLNRLAEPTGGTVRLDGVATGRSTRSSSGRGSDWSRRRPGSGPAPSART